eukprot:TRINITY_DN108824_c0_g1_i1.p1 TRINITY_DN108824_c0_g1~~TRINITY_DN108824_c0_g1_i1.p1  ORF type:complete len:145 (-),score=3.48 TRINITY_DN108824_c0_g1_i1:61-495(-)
MPVTITQTMVGIIGCGFLSVVAVVVAAIAWMLGSFAINTDVDVNTVLIPAQQLQQVTASRFTKIVVKKLQAVNEAALPAAQAGSTFVEMRDAELSQSSKLTAAWTRHLTDKGYTVSACNAVSTPCWRIAWEPAVPSQDSLQFAH